MKPRRFFAIVSVLCLTVSVILLVRDRHASAAPQATHEIELTSGQKTNGVIMQLRPTAYLIQGTDRCLLFSEDEVRGVDGKGLGEARIPVADDVPLVYETLEKILPEGQVEGHYHFRTRNNGSTVLTELNWGIAPHEIARLEHYRVIDEFGMELPMRVEDDPRIAGKRVFVKLFRPALPGDEVRVTIIVREPGISRSGEDWVYRVEGDYPEKRLVTRSVLLPKGAQIVSVTPEPAYQTTSTDGALVVWRRFFVAGERNPWEVRYRL